MLWQSFFFLFPIGIRSFGGLQEVSTQHNVSLSSPKTGIYAVEILVGGQPLEVVVDTGSSLFAVSAAAGFGGPFFDGTCTGPNIYFHYSSATLSGLVCSGVDVELGGVDLGKPVFGGITNSVSDPVLGSLTGPLLQGILGMAYYNLNLVSKYLAMDKDKLVELGCAADFCSSAAGAADAAADAAAVSMAETAIATGGDATAEAVAVAAAAASNISDLDFACSWLCPKKGSENIDLFKPVLDQFHIFSMMLCGSRSDRHGESGRLLLGGIDSLYSGGIEYTPIILEVLYFVNVTAVGTSVSAMAPCETPTLSQAKSQGIPQTALDYVAYQDSAYYVDSGNPYLVLGTDAFANVQTSINKAAVALGLGTVVQDRFDDPTSTLLPCATRAELVHFPDIIIELAGDVTLRVPPEKYMQTASASSTCLQPLVSSSLGGGGVLGLPVLESYYTVYDKGNKRIGFAPMTECEDRK